MLNWPVKLSYYLSYWNSLLLFSTPHVCQCLTPCRSSSERQLQLLCTVFGVIQRGDVPMSSVLEAMMERVLLPLASHCSTKALNDFFVTNVSDIIVLLLSRFTKVCVLTFWGVFKENN